MQSMVIVDTKYPGTRATRISTTKLLTRMREGGWRGWVRGGGRVRGHGFEGSRTTVVAGYSASSVATSMGI